MISIPLLNTFAKEVVSLNCHFCPKHLEFWSWKSTLSLQAVCAVNCKCSGVARSRGTQPITQQFVSLVDAFPSDHFRDDE